MKLRRNFFFYFITVHNWNQTWNGFSYNRRKRKRSFCLIGLIVLSYFLPDASSSNSGEENNKRKHDEIQLLRVIYQTETGFMNARAYNRRNPTFRNSNDEVFNKEKASDGSYHHVLQENEVDDIWKDPFGYCNCWNSTDGGTNREVECKCSGFMNRLVSPLPLDVHRIVVKDGWNFTNLKNEDLRRFANSLKELSLTDLPGFNGIDDGAFHGMTNLHTIYIMEMPALTNISQNVFNIYLPKLKIIRISHSSLRIVPMLSSLKTLQHLDLLDLENNRINHLQIDWIKNIQVNYLSLSYNRIEQIGANAFSGSTISRLKLKGNPGLVYLDPEAFVGIQHLSELDLSETSITQLPTIGLKQIEKLKMENVFSLRVIPSIYNFDNLKEAWLTFPYHCCAFEFPETHNPLEYAKNREFLNNLVESGCHNENLSVPNNGTSIRTLVASTFTMNNSSLKRKKKRDIANTQDFDGNTNPQLHEYDPFAHEDDKSFGNLTEGFSYKTGISGNEHRHGQKPHGSISSSGSEGLYNHNSDDFGTFHSDVVTGPPSTRIKAHCGNVATKKFSSVKCKPLPDAFSPCEDIMGNVWLRIAVWVVVGLALVGNTAVLVVLILAPGRMTVQRFLMANLSWADLCMGIYLLMVATEDMISLGAYFNYAIDWQLGWGCQLAGFFTVFASELSVFTLAVITAERWYALTRALHLTKRLTIVKASQLMLIGWFISIILALLPLVGISSYSKTSICLPMEATTPEAITYLCFLLIFNGIAFSMVALAYWQMYRAVAGHGNMTGSSTTASHSADAAIAKKMALLVFTDFACWAPVAFFGLTAVAGAPLIGVTDSKILLVFFYPLNACCNPYLYAILTKQYRRDLLLLLSRHGLCLRRAARYKTGQTGSTNNTLHTMQTILRLGSVAETKMASSNGNGNTSGSGTTAHQDSLCASNTEGHSEILTASNVLTNLTSTASIPKILNTTGSMKSKTESTKTHKPSISSITENDEEERLLAETSFILIPSSSSIKVTEVDVSKPSRLFHRPNSIKEIGKQKHVRISTGSTSPTDDEISVSLPKTPVPAKNKTLSEVSNENEPSECTPFYS